MREDHRVIHEERFAPISPDEIENEVLTHVRSILAFKGLELAIHGEAGIRVAIAAAHVRPEAMLVEAEVPGQRGVLGSKLPFPGNAGGVTRPAKDMAESGLRFVERAEVHIVPHVRHASHQLGARRRAIRLGIAVLKAHALARQSVQIRRAIRLAAIGPDALVAEVIGEDDDDVGFASRLWRIGGLQGFERKEEG